jgi:hypothetical protein
MGLQYIRKDKQYDAPQNQTPQIAVFSPTLPGVILIAWTEVDLMGRVVSFPSLEATDDAWGLLANIPAFIEMLALLDDRNAPPDVIEYMIKHDLGYKDLTQRDAPQEAVA